MKDPYLEGILAKSDTHSRLPEWAVSTAERLTGKSRQYSREVMDIARALAETERRGLERAAKVAETGYWSSALGGATGPAVAFAIRKLMESSDEA